MKTHYFDNTTSMPMCWDGMAQNIAMMSTRVPKQVTCDECNLIIKMVGVDKSELTPEQEPSHTGQKPAMHPLEFDAPDFDYARSRRSQSLLSRVMSYLR